MIFVAPVSGHHYGINRILFQWLQELFSKAGSYGVSYNRIGFKERRRGLQPCPTMNNIKEAEALYFTPQQFLRHSA